MSSRHERVVDLAAAEAYLTRRYGTRPGYIALSTKDNVGRFQNFFYFNDEEGRAELLKKVKTAAKVFDVYVCPMLRTEENRTVDSAEQHSFTLWADVDQGEIPEQLLPYVEVVESGSEGHYHVYIPVHDCDDLTVAELETMNLALKNATDGDNKWRNNTLLRLPGTFNYKHRPATPVRVLKLQDDVMPLWSLAQMLRKCMPERDEVPWYPEKYEVQKLRWQVVDMDELPTWYQELLDQQGNLADRSGKCWRFLLSGFELGLSKEEVFFLALRHQPTLSKFNERRNGIASQVLKAHHHYRQKEGLDE